MINDNDQAINNLYGYFETIFPLSLRGDQPHDLVPALSKDGAVQYNVYQFNEAPKELQKQVETGRLLMERFVGVASAAVNKKADKSDKDKYHFTLWNDVSQQIINAFFANQEKGERHLNTEVTGISIAKTVIEFLGSVMAGNVTSFADFLKSFGEGLNVQMGKTQADYNYLCAYSTHDIFQDQSGNVFYTPQFLVYGTHFSQTQRTITTSCSSYSHVILDFAVQTSAATFKIEQYMKDQVFRKKVDDFLDKFEGKNIADTDSYFDDIFSDVKPDDKKLTMMK